MTANRALLASLLLPLALQANQFSPTTATGWGPDDWNVSTLNPTTYGSAPIGNFVQTILDGAGFSPANGWTVNFANGAFLNTDVEVTNYYAWVVNSPDIALPDGNHNVDIHGDAGGAVFTFTYTQKDPAHDPAPGDLHIIQLYSQSLNGGPTQFKVDNDNSQDSPFYDKAFPVAVQTAGNQLFFSDEPFLCENIVVCNQEGPENTGGSFSFGAYLVKDDTSSGSHVLTVYGGYQWGYTYSNADAPEPAGMFLAGLGLVILGAIRKVSNH